MFQNPGFPLLLLLHVLPCHAKCKTIFSSHSPHFFRSEIYYFTVIKLKIDLRLKNLSAVIIHKLFFNQKHLTKFLQSTKSKYT